MLLDTGDMIRGVVRGDWPDSRGPGLSKTYRAWDPDQTYLLPPAPRDWLPDGDLVANASRHKAMSCEYTQKEEQCLHKETAKLLAKAKSADEAEDALHGPDTRGDELPEELARRETRLAQIKHARGFRQFLLRGMEKMRGEWSLVCMTHNLLKLFPS